MNFKKNIILLICLLVILAVTVGCGGNQTKAPAGQPKETPNAGTQEKKETWPKGGSLGTASVGGTLYVWGGAWGKLTSDKLPQFPINVEVTGGPVHNIQLVDKGEMEFGLVSMPAAEDAWKGLNWAKGNNYKNIRALLPMYPSLVAYWTIEKTGIKSVKDLNGKIVNAGPSGGTPDTYCRQFIKMSKVTPANIVNSGFTDAVGQLGDGIIHAILNTGGSPHPSILETEATYPTVVFSHSEEEIDAILKETAAWFKGYIPKGDYKSLDKDLPTLQYWNIVITNKDLPDSLAYEVTKLYFENLKAFENVYKPTKDTIEKDILKTAIPIHPGAAKYYREKGVNIPPELIGK